MPQPTPAYDLFVLIDPEVPDERRAGMVDEVRKRISAGDGSLKGDVEWGTRKLAYEIKHRSDAYYHLFQFEGPAELLRTLDRALAIEDGVLRHRILRLPKGAPDEPPKPPAPRHAEPVREGRHPRRAPAAPGGEESETPPPEGDAPAPAAEDAPGGGAASEDDSAAASAPGEDGSPSPTLEGEQSAAS